jgi:hypothetical protein
VTNREQLQQLYDEWARGNFTRTDIFDPAVRSKGHGIRPEGPIESEGLEEMWSWIGDWLRAWERPLLIEAEEFVEAGDRIAALIRWKGKGKGSGTPIEGEGAHLWEFRAGKAVRFDVYRHRDEALAALRDEGE